MPAQAPLVPEAAHPLAPEDPFVWVTPAGPMGVEEEERLVNEKPGGADTAGGDTAAEVGGR